MEVEVEADVEKKQEKEQLMGHAEVEMEMETAADAENDREVVAVEQGGGQARQPFESEKSGEGSDQQYQRAMAAGRSMAWRGGGGFHRTMNVQRHKRNNFNKDRVYGGAIIICNRMTKREFFQQRLFSLPACEGYFIQKIKAGMLLFLFECEERKLYGMFEATADGALNIVPNAYTSSGEPLPSQVLFKRVWFCKPVTEAEFCGAIKEKYFQNYRFRYGLLYRQVLHLVYLFSSKRIGLQPYQKATSRVIHDYEISLARVGLGSSLHTPSNIYATCSFSISCNNTASLPHKYCRSSMHINPNVYDPPYNYTHLHPRCESEIFKAPKIQGKDIEPNVDYIPLDVDDCESNSDADLSDMLETESCSSKSDGSMSYEEPKPFDRKCDEDDGKLPHVAKPRLHSEGGKGHKGCKRKAILQFDGYSDVLSPRLDWTLRSKESFCSGAGEKLVASSDKALIRPALAELEQNRVAAVKGKRKLVFSDVWSRIQMPSEHP